MMNDYRSRQAARIRLAIADAERAHNTPPAQPGRRQTMAIGYSHDPGRELLAAVTDAIVARSLGREPSPLRGGIYADSGGLFARLAYACLMRTGRDAGLVPDDRGRVIDLAMTTSDFAFALRGVANKVLLDSYQSAAVTYPRFAARKDFRSFRTTDLVQPVEFPVPLATAEAGEAHLGAFLESGEVGQLISYRSRVSISRQALVNDDIGTLGDLATAAAARCRDLEERLVIARLESSATLRDGTPLFHSSRGNLAAAGAAISATTISAGRAAMLGAVAPGGTKAVAVPKFLLVPPGLLTLSEVELAKLNPGADAASRIVPITSPHLSSSTAWFLLAAAAQRPALVYSRLEGTPGPVVVTRESWEDEGIEVATTLDFGVTAADPRGGYKNPGA